MLAPAPGTVTVSFEGPVPQRRITVAFRVILAIPHLLYLYVLTLVAYVVVVIGWFGALFTGQLPNGLDTFITRLIQQFARVYSYAWLLLTDRYPSFALDEPDYPVTVEVTPTRLNRWAVLARLFLLIPLTVVLWLLSVGLMIVSIVVWLIVLVAGRLPAPLFEAYAATLRYQVRVYAYAAMLTGEYPRGLFGDRVDDTSGVALSDPSELPTRPRITRLVLSKAGKRLVALIMAIGALFGVGFIAVSAVLAVQTTETERDLDRFHDQLGSATEQFAAEGQACAVSGGIDCLHAANRRVADVFERFGRQLELLELSAFAEDAAAELQDDAFEIAAVQRRLASVTTQREYQAGITEFQRLALRFDEHYEELVYRL